MKKNYLLLAMASLALGACATGGDQHSKAEKHEAAHWGYAGAIGPEHWGKLKAEFSTCDSGSRQSPVDIVGAEEEQLPGVQFSYVNSASEILNNGHTVQVNFPAGNIISLGGHSYELKQFHFHAPSENHIGGADFPMEGHWVHADDKGHLAVIGVMFSDDGDHYALRQLWSQLPEAAGDRHTLKHPVSAAALLPANRDYYSFDGSLTTPPCSEGVRWMVMRTPVRVSAEQIAQFKVVLGEPNNRPVQPLNGRSVAK